MTDIQTLSAHIPDAMAGKRLDQALAALFPDYSRSRIQQWMRGGNVTVDGKPATNLREKVRGGEHAELQVVLEKTVTSVAQALPLEVVYEDASLLVINKPVGLVVHPAAGNPHGTLLNALLHYAPELENIPRAGIVHRLDKGTSGLLVIARTLAAQTHLVEQLQARTMGREYHAIVVGNLISGGTVDAPIGRHPVERKKMAVNERGKAAVSHYRVVERFRNHTHVRVKLETGRTHQIRVHMTHVGYPLIGDAAYGGRLRIPKGCDERVVSALREFRHQALHAAALRLTHPHTKEEVQWQAPLPDDMTQLLALLRQDALPATPQP